MLGKQFIRKFTLLKKFGKMPTLEQVIEKTKQAEQLLSSLRAELKAVNSDICSRKKKELLIENAALERQIQFLVIRLTAIDMINGKPVIEIPGEPNHFFSKATNPNKEPVLPTSPSKTEKSEPKKVAPNAEQPIDDSSKTTSSNKQPVLPTLPSKKEKSEPKKVAPNVEQPIDVARLDLRVGKIIEAKVHPDADSLYVEKIDCGDPEPRTVVSGLVKFVPLTELQDRMVVVLCNLKPAKMRGITSEAMVMCASTPTVVELLIPPASVSAGDHVYCEGFERTPDSQLNPKKKIFETCAPDLMTNENLVACYKGNPLYVPSKGNIVAKTLKNAKVK